MRKIKKIISIMISTILIFTPYYVSAEEPNPTPSVEPSPTPSVSPEPIETPEPEPTPTPEIKSITLDEIKITLNPNETTQLTATVTPSNSVIVWESSNDEVATVDNNGKVTAGKSSGSATITATIDKTEIKAECRVVVNASSDATLKSLTISNGTLNKSFKSDVLEYSITVESSVNSLMFKDLEADLNNSKAGYLVTGNKDLKNNDVVTILVTAEDKKTTSEYKLTIIKDTVNLNLKSLKINGYALNESFSAEKLEYTASIPYEIETISVQAAAEDSNAKVNVSGITNLKVGANTVTITVQDDSGNNRVYQIIVTREKEVVIEENPTSIITSSNVNDQNQNSNNTNISNNDNNTNDDFLKYAIVSIACLILFAIGGIGIYFYLKTSPRKLKKEVKNKKKEETTSPIIEVEHNQTSENHSNITEIMDEKLIETREFKKEDFETNSHPENLFDDIENNDKDV